MVVMTRTLCASLSLSVVLVLIVVPHFFETETMCMKMKRTNELIDSIIFYTIFKVEERRQPLL